MFSARYFSASVFIKPSIFSMPSLLSALADSGFSNILFCDCRGRRLHLPHSWRFVQGAQTSRANQHSFAVYGCVLDVRILSGPVYGVIMAAEELSFASHPRSFVAHFTLSH